MSEPTAFHVYGNAELEDFSLRGLATMIERDADALAHVNGDMASRLRGAVIALRLAHTRIYGVPSSKPTGEP